MQDRILNVEQVAEYLACHPSTIYRLLKRRAIPAFKVASEWRFSLLSIERWQRNAEMEAAADLDKD